MTDQTIYQIGLTMINGIGDILGRQLLQAFGSAEAIFAEKPSKLEKIPGIGGKLAAEIKRKDILIRAEKEFSFIEKNQINCFFLTDKDYPSRLRECPDAPLMLYFKGKTDFNAQKSISIVGTRKNTSYGNDLAERFIKDLSVLFPDLLIVSGLAYGIDIIAHRCALRNQLNTVGVLAHGLDRIYPPAHRSTAIEMLEKGGLLTDFPSGSNPDKQNFVMRNRIIAGLADATVVVESANKGGSLITAEIAFSYERDIFAFPGKVNDMYSQGCNRLIRQNIAGLITSADDLVMALCWDKQLKPKEAAKQTQLFFAENDDNSRIMAILQEKKEIHINELAIKMDMPVYQLSTLLFELEMDGYIKAVPGSRYRLI